jgi:hypothetical protein
MLAVSSSRPSSLKLPILFSSIVMLSCMPLIPSVFRVVSLVVYYGSLGPGCSFMTTTLASLVVFFSL